MREKYKSLVRSWKVGLEINQYYKKIRKGEQIICKNHPKLLELENKLVGLDWLGGVVAQIAPFIKNPVGTYLNSFYIIRNREMFGH